MKRIISLGLSLMLLLPFVVGSQTLTVQAAEEKNCSITANIIGAEIYLNDEYSGENAPADIKAQVGDTIAMYLPGYYAESQTVETGKTGYDFVLVPELYPAEYADNSKHMTIDVGSGYAYSSLSHALEYMATIDDSIWCVIELHDGADTWNVPEDYFRARNHYTIYGGENGYPMNSEINPWGVDGLRLINLDFSSRAGSAQFKIRAMLSEKRAAIYTKNIYICGCTFKNCSELGIHQCVEFNKGGTDYDSDGTYNVSNINFSNNDIISTDAVWGIFNFASAGDGDYNVIDGYKVIANRFVNAGIGFLTADAHSWYVYAQTAIDFGNYDASGDMENGEIGICENNAIRNILISGNEIRNGTIGIQSANLGNQNNILEDVIIRSNHVYSDYRDIEGPYPEAWNGALSIQNVAVADNYEDDRYFVTPGFTHTDNNTLRNVEVYNNYFESSRSRGVSIVNVNPVRGEQCGKDNTMSNIQIKENEFISANGVLISNIGGGESTAESSSCESNTMTDVVFENNTITNPIATDKPGILVTSGYISKHNEQYPGYPNYSGSMDKIHINNNSINDYIYGISVSGCFGDYLDDYSISDVEIKNNTINNKNQFEYAVTDVGIIIAGSTGQTSSHEYSPDLANSNGKLSNVTVEGNIITARCGIIAAGLVTTRSLDKPSTNNTITGISLNKNRINQRPQQAEFVNMGDDYNTGAGIIVADAVSFHNNLIEDDYNIYELTSGCKASEVTLNDNVISADFEVHLVNGSEEVDDSWEVRTVAGLTYAKKNAGACRAIQLHNIPQDAHTHTGGSANCNKKAECTICGKEYGEYAEHTFTQTLTAATLTANGKKETKCSVCGEVPETTTIYAAKTVNLSAAKYTYDGKAKKPVAIVKDSRGVVIPASNYTVSYDSGRTNVGKYSVKITFKGDYRGTKSLSFIIKPPKTTFSSVKAGKKSFTAKWKKKTAQVTGYEIQYSTSSTFKSGNKTVKVTSAKSTSKAVRKLVGGKKYYVRIRTYRKLGKTTYYSDWSAKKTVKPKK